MAAVILEARGLTKTFGGLRAVDGVDFDLRRGEIHALIGPNGAGKTTFVSLLCGRIAPSSGTIRFEGRDITRLPAHARVRLGIAYTFQITSIFPRLTAFENVAIAAQRLGSRGCEARARAVLERVGIAAEAGARAGDLSYGHQRLVEIAMGLALEPRLLILDEPTQGLANAEVDRFAALIEGLAGGATILLIEHNMDLVMRLAERITVLDGGTKLAEGAPEAIRADPAVRAAYLGG
ncbi:ABC transporter ATP-binding protein [Amaricoccus solimangrovi]|uniref:ABC transporter ATP-binding protein n=1 Tax=Amaricoccus solimangrovi TaxID=2589815 RepID=A0A501X161_9RHOB|nr:ABC transporter ATP-binding protein [Amaricoccus solimangrovi]TPE53166.1 ABC transporter ATP-binding protein [Amaricoccus solimangrovi]